MKVTFDKNAEKFVNLMVEKIENLTLDWSKPWFNKVNVRRNFIPQNLSGRAYAGGNAFLLSFLCEENNYQTPVFLTFKQAKEKGINVLKGSTSFPVYYTLFCAYHLTKNEKISLEEYKELAEEEKKQYRLVSYNQYYLVFNLDQTNFSEKYPEKWDALRSKFVLSEIDDMPENPRMYENILLDEMISKQTWVCPVMEKDEDKAYYSILKDHIILPRKEQFKDGESFYSTTLHEMAHSTGIKTRLNRKDFYNNELEKYGKEELVAELSAALAGLYLGISSTIREENAAYLKSWCKSIREEPRFLFNVLTDSVRAVKFIAEKVGFSLSMEEAGEEKDIHLKTA